MPSVSRVLLSALLFLILFTVLRQGSVEGSGHGRLRHRLRSVGQRLRRPTNKTGSRFAEKIKCRVIVLSVKRCSKWQWDVPMPGHLCSKIRFNCLPIINSLPEMYKFIRKFEKKKGRVHLLFSEKLPPSMVLLANALKVPALITKSDIEVPRMPLFNSVTFLRPASIIEYRAILEYAVQRATTEVRSIVFLVEPKFLISAGQEIRVKVPSERVLETRSNEFTDQLANRFSNVPVLFVGLGYRSNNQTHQFFSSLTKRRKGKTYVFMPYLVFQDLMYTVEKNQSDGLALFDLLNSVDAYITRQLNIKNLLQKAAIHYIIKVIERCQLERIPKRVDDCIAHIPPYNEKKNEWWRNVIKDSRETEFLRVARTYQMFSYNGIYKMWKEEGRPKTANIDSLFSQEQQLVARKGGIRHNWYNIIDRYSVIMNLESPMVMIRNMTSENDCEYGLRCRLDDEAVVRCCFGLAVDIARQLRKLNSLSRTSDEMSNVRFMCERVPDCEIEVFVYSHRKLWPNSTERKNETDFDDALLRHLVRGDYDIAIGSHVIVSSEYLDKAFVTKPFFSSPIGIMISRKERLASYRVLSSFAAPFHWTVWLCVFIIVNITAVACVICEWNSPYGLTPRGRDRLKVFSFPSALNLCWSVLFSHTVATKSPKCWSSRFITNVYAFFCIIFFASYTGNLAAYMSGRKLLYEISGIHDNQLKYGNIRVATVYGSATHYHLQKAQRQLFKFVKLVDSVEDAFNQIRNREIDAFIYDISTLNYFKRVFHKDDFEIVGKPFAQISYSVAIASKFKREGLRVRDCISSVVSDSRLDSELTNDKVWIRDVPGLLVNGQRSNFSIETQNFLGPLLLFLCGIITGLIALLFEYIVFRTVVPWFRKSLKNKKSILPFTQRLYRQMFTTPDYNKYAFSERKVHKLVTPIAERLSNYRRPSTTYPVDIGRLLCSATERSVSSTKSCPNLSKDNNGNEGLTAKCPISATDETMSSGDELGDQQETKADVERALLPLTPFNLSNDQSNFSLVSPPPPLYDPGLHCVIAKRVNNMAVQTDIEAWVENRLAPVDANITVRTRDFERDMRQMRGEVARLMREKERLLRRLQRYENKTREQMERDLLNERSGSEERLLRQLQSRLEPNSSKLLEAPLREMGSSEERRTLPNNQPPPYLTVKNNLNV